MEDNAIDAELEKRWKEVLEKYEKATDRKLGAQNPDEINKRAEDIAHETRHEILKKTAMSALKVAKYASSVASSVYPHASIIVTALTALADTAEVYRSNFSKTQVQKRLQSVDGTLIRMQEYMSSLQDGVQIDPILGSSILRLFTEILDLCTTYSKLENDSKKAIRTLKNIMSSVIRYDRMQRHLDAIREETELQLKNNVAALRISDMSSSTVKRRMENANKLSSYLKIPVKGQLWAVAQNNLEAEHIAGMGEWLSKLPNVASWLDASHLTDTPILTLTADSGRGKSHLCSQIISHLKKKKEEEGRNSVIRVAWHYFREAPRSAKASGSKGMKSVEDSNAQHRLVDALRVLIWQLAESDTHFQTFVVKELSRDRHFSSKAVDLWTTIILEYTKKFKSDIEKPQKVLYLILDGYGTSESDTSREDNAAITRIKRDISENRKRDVQVRLLWSNSESLEPSNAAKISLDSQEWDVETFIQHHLKESKETWSQGSEEQRLLLGIRMRLAAEFEGNYHELETTLQDVKRSGRKGLSYLQEFREGDQSLSSVIVRQKLEMLSEDLESDYINILNELILCLAFWKAWPTVQLLRDYLLLRQGRKFEGSIEALLDKFAGLASIPTDSNAVLWGHQKFFDEIQQPLTYPVKKDMAKFNARLHLYEQTQMDHIDTRRFKTASLYLAQGCRHLREIDALNDWIEQHRTMRPRVHVEPIRSRVEAIFALLQIVCDEDLKDRPESKRVNEYTAAFLPQHFADISDEQLKEVPQEMKEYIGRFLSIFFTDESTVESWMPRGDIDEYLLWDWETTLQDVVRWLRDPSVKRGFRLQCYARPDQKDKKQTETNTNPTNRSSSTVVEKLQDGGYHQETTHAQIPPFSRARPLMEIIGICYGAISLHELLDVPMKVVASQWLQGCRWDALKTFQLFSNISLEILYSQSTNRVKLQEECPKFKNVSEDGQVEMIEKAEKSAKTRIHISEEQAHRNTNHDVRLAETFMTLPDPAASSRVEHRCQRVLLRDPLNIKAVLYLSRALEKRNRTDLALAELMKIRHNIQSAAFRSSDRRTWESELERFWNLCLSTGSAKEAFTACRDLSEEFPEDPMPPEKAQEWIMRNKKLDKDFEILSIPRKAGCSLLAKLFRDNAQLDEFHQKFYLTKGCEHIICQTYLDAISGSNLTIMQHVYLRYHYGMGLFYQGKPSEAVKVWEESIEKLKDTQEWTINPKPTFEAFSCVVERLASSYIEKILEKDPTHPPHEYIGKFHEYKRILNQQRSHQVSYLDVLFGRAYLIMGHPNKATSLVRPYMSEALGLLKDGKDSNDWEGFQKLAQALNSLGDEENAQAAWSLIVNDPDRDRECHLSISCAGDCDWEWSGSKDLKKKIRICQNCPNLYFEDDCYKRLKKNALKKKTCSATHTFLPVPMRQKKEVRFAKDRKVLVGEVTKDIDAWLESIRIKYGITGPEPSSHTNPKAALKSLSEKARMESWNIRRQIRTDNWKLRRQFKVAAKKERRWLII